MRKATNKKALCPHMTNQLLEPFCNVSEDLINKVRHMRDTAGSDELAEQLPMELYKWGMECKFSVISNVRQQIIPAKYGSMGCGRN